MFAPVVGSGSALDLTLRDAAAESSGTEVEEEKDMSKKHRRFLILGTVFF